MSSKIVDLPVPQLPKMPTLIGINSFSVIRSFIDSAVSLKFKKSTDDSLSDYIGDSCLVTIMMVNVDY